jgi:inner membrane protein
MPTIITHTAVPLALGIGLGSAVVPRRLLLAGVAASMIPDLDVIGFKLGIAYADSMGHRGITHSLLFAVILGVLAFAMARRLNARPIVAGIFVLVSCVSHGLLDMCTTGGLGIAFLWPYSRERYFLPWQFIQVAPLSLDKVFSPWGWRVMHSELLGVWLPSLLAGGVLAAARRWLAPRPGYARR